MHGTFATLTSACKVDFPFRNYAAFPELFFIGACSVALTHPSLKAWRGNGERSPPPTSITLDGSRNSSPILNRPWGLRWLLAQFNAICPCLSTVITSVKGLVEPCGHYRLPCDSIGKPCWQTASPFSSSEFTLNTELRAKASTTLLIPSF